MELKEEKIVVKKIDLKLKENLINKLMDCKVALASNKTDEEIEKAKSELHISLDNAVRKSCDEINDKLDEILKSFIYEYDLPDILVFYDEEDYSLICLAVSVLHSNKH